MKSDEIIYQILELGETIFYSAKVMKSYSVKLFVQSLKVNQNLWVGLRLAINRYGHFQQIHIRRLRIVLVLVQNYAEYLLNIVKEMGV